MNERLKAGLGLAAGLSFLGGAGVAEAQSTPQAEAVAIDYGQELDDRFEVEGVSYAIGGIAVEGCRNVDVWDEYGNLISSTIVCDGGSGGGSGGGTPSPTPAPTPQNPNPSRPNPTAPTNIPTQTGTVAPQLSYEGRMARDHGPECAYDWEANTPWGPYFSDVVEMPEGFDESNIDLLLAHPEYWTPQNVIDLLSKAEGWYEEGEPERGSHELTRFYEVCGTGGFIDGNRWINGFGLTDEAYEQILAETGHPPTLLDVLFVVDEEGNVTFSGEPVLLSQQRLLEKHIGEVWVSFSQATGVDAREFAASGGTSLADLVASQQAA